MPKEPEPYVQSGAQLNEFLRTFWQRQIDTAEQERLDYRHPALPLARIKKVMKSDLEVKMIAADGPILFCKACEIFIAEITARAFLVADANKRRTLSRSDVAKAIARTDQFDFLIDIVPRDEPGGGTSAPKKNAGTGSGAGVGGREFEDEGKTDDPVASASSRIAEELDSLLASDNPGQEPSMPR